MIVVGCLAVTGLAACGGSTQFSAAPTTGAAAAPATAPSTGPATSDTPTVVSTKPTVCTNVQGALSMSDGMVMAPVPSRKADAADQRAATTLIQSVNAGIAKYSQLSAAVAAGYVPATNPRGYVVHYADWSVVQAGDVLDANRPSSLVYANTVAGPILLGAMFLGPAPCQPGPDVAGPLTQWHAHANLCLSASHEVVGQSNAGGQCAVGNHNTNTFFMMHVWTAPSLAQNYQFAAHVPTTAYAAIIRSGRP